MKKRLFLALLATVSTVSATLHIPALPPTADEALQLNAMAAAEQQHWQETLAAQQTAATAAAGAAKPAPAKPAPRPAVRQGPTTRNNMPARAPRSTGRSVILRSTAYNSIPNQTDSTPFITATGTRTRVGVVAMSRDMLRVFPYGTRVRIEYANGRGHPYLNGRIFVVEDTMHPRKRGQVDVWMPSRRQALQWGVQTVRVTAVR